MRVITGKYKGRRLVCPKGLAARPTGDKVKEALFGAIQFQIEGARVLDAFAGSGALGIEALSRGAAHADFVEKDKKCVQALETNLSRTGAQNFNIYNADLFAVMGLLQRYNIVFVDPPYQSGLYFRFLHSAAEHNILEQNALVVLETHSKFAFKPVLGYNLTKCASYCDTSLWYLYYEKEK